MNALFQDGHKGNVSVSPGKRNPINSRIACAGKLLPLLLLLALPTVVQAQYDYTVEGGAITITRYTGFGGVVTIPSMLYGLPVTVIRYGAFNNCTNVTHVTIPNSITTIGYGAFSLCSRLTRVTIPNSVTTMGHEEFYRCSSLTNVTIGAGVTRIGDLTFGYCTGLTSVTIGDGVTSIGESAFENCTSLTGVYFQGNAPSVDDPYTFHGANHATVYYLAGTTGWTDPWGGRPTALWEQTSSWSTGAVDLGGGWKRLLWFGDYADLGSDWIWHLQHGYEYAYTASTPTSIYFWDFSGLGWLWTSSTLYPYLYRFSDGAWLWYVVGTNPRWFKNFKTGQWELH